MTPDSLTLVHARVFILQDSEFVDFAELFKQRLQVLFVCRWR